jgi:UDP-N-acetylglucosamine 2-epimerase
MVLVTLHRRENFGAPLQRILESLRSFADTHPETHLVYPVHPNPNVLAPVQACLSNLPNVHILPPLEYPTLVRLLRDSYAVFTDSGGLQEEGPALGKPVLVFRDVTERPEAVAESGAVLVGSDPGTFLRVALPLWEDSDHYARMAVPRFPYGRGDASERITSVLKPFLGVA